MLLFLCFVCLFVCWLVGWLVRLRKVRLGLFCCCFFLNSLQAQCMVRGQVSSWSRRGQASKSWVQAPLPVSHWCPFQVSLARQRLRWLRLVCPIRAILFPIPQALRKQVFPVEQAQRCFFSSAWLVASARGFCVSQVAQIVFFLLFFVDLVMRWCADGLIYFVCNEEARRQKAVA